MLSFQFESFNDLVWMNGHGPYVWGAYAIVLVALMYLVWEPLTRRKRVLRSIARAEKLAVKQQGQSRN